MTDSKTVAIIGASSNPAKYGYKSVVAHRRAGWQVFPVNPNEQEIAGLPVYRTMRDIPVPQLDRVSLYLPPHIGLTVLEDIASKRVGEFYVNPGAESDKLVARARELGLVPILACSILAAGQ